MFRWPALLGALILLAMALVILVQGPAEVRTVGPAPAGSPITSTLSGPVTFDVFASSDEDGDVVCRDAQGKAMSTLQFPIPGEQVIDGTQWSGTGARVELREGESTTCSAKVPGDAQILLVHRTGLVRTLQAALFGVMGLIGLTFWLFGVRAARRSRGVAS
jgi:hypothetical protein